MTAKEYLLQVRRCKLHADNKRKQYNHAVENLKFLQGIDYAKDRVQTSPEDSLSVTMAHLVDAEREALEAIEESNRLLQEGTTRINSLSKHEYVEVLTRRYLEDDATKRTFEAISCAMGYTYFHTCHLHGEALQEFEKKFM